LAFIGAFRRHEPDTPLTLVERELVGGECSYWACMPAKALLRPPETLAAAERVPGASAGRLEPAGLFRHRDEAVDHWDDARKVEWLRERNVELVRGHGRVAAPGCVDVDGRPVPYGRLVVATGSAPEIPPIDGLEEGGYWTSREATAVKELPESLVVLGGGPVGCELAQFFARAGSELTLIEPQEQLLGDADPEAGELIRATLEADGAEVLTGAKATRAAHGGVALEGGRTIEAERLLVAAGRRPNTRGLGLEHAGVTLDDDEAVVVDERLRAGESVWAVGDVTAVAMFTHAGKYQARVAAADAAGLPARADYRAIPAVTFTDPQVATVGQTEERDGVLVARRAVEAAARSATYERPRRAGYLKLFAAADSGLLVGASAVGPEAGEWLGQATLAVRAEVPIDLLVETIQPYPTFSEAFFFAARELQGRLSNNAR
jgi:dihydrolipoamide dehydrogenase